MVEKPNYIIRTNEAVLFPKEQSGGIVYLKIGVIVVVVVIIVGSLLFQQNLFAELSWTPRIILITLVLTILTMNGGKEYGPSPMELQFYDEYLVLKVR